VNRAQFEAAFDSRTLAYAAEFAHASEPIVVVVGPASDNRAGHTLLLTLCNLLARAHRRVLVVGNLARPLVCPSVFGISTLEQATVGLMRSINPFGDFQSVAAASERALLTIGVGASDPTIDLALGCAGWVAILDKEAPIGSDDRSIWGAALAACLGANAAFHRALGERELPSGNWSGWDYLKAGTAQGPVVDGPLDVGRVLQVGAGAVGSALDYFLMLLLGIDTPWTIVDGDLVDVSNLNRQLVFVARDAGFPDLEPVNKANRAAEMLGPHATASAHWYGEDEAVVEATYDVVLALANDRGVRSFLQGRQPTVLLHATTSPNWQAQLHRHIAGRDDCIDCRLPAGTPRFTCSTEEVVDASGARFDAAVPPLSAIAGFLLITELVRLGQGSLLEERANYTAVELLTAVPSATQRLVRSCRDGCRVRKQPDVRRGLDANSRWLDLDTEPIHS
jgi:Dinucleotide-utilizing enzymes involved in molybdopterin and thiamine biosynthesis family 2